MNLYETAKIINEAADILKESNDAADRSRCFARYGDHDCKHGDCAPEQSLVVQAYCGTRRGGSCVRPVDSKAEAEKILRGGYGVTTVTLEANPGAHLVGQRWKDRGRWLWFYDPSFFPENEGHAQAAPLKCDEFPESSEVHARDAMSKHDRLLLELGIKHDPNFEPWYCDSCRYLNDTQIHGPRCRRCGRRRQS